jgi:hypothetical protein
MRHWLIFFWVFSGGLLSAQEEFTLKSGEQLSHLNQYGQSTEQLEAFIRSNPSRLYDQSEALLLISYNHMQLGDYANALATNEASLSIKGQLHADDLVKNYVRYGAIHLLRGNYPLALSYLLRAKDLPIEDIPLYAVIDGHLAAAYRGLGQYERAAAYYKQSIETLLIEYPADHPEIILSYYNLGQLYVEWGRPDEARKYFQEGLDRSSPSSDTAFLRAMLYNGLGQTYATQPQQAAGIYRQALEVANQNFGKYHRETAHATLLLAEALMAQQEGEAAQRAILSAIQSLSPEQPNLRWEEMPDSANIAIDPLLLGAALGLRAAWLLQLPETTSEQLQAALENSEQAAFWLFAALEQHIDQANRTEIMQAARKALLPGIQAGIRLWEEQQYKPAQLRAFRLTEAIRRMEFQAHTTYPMGLTGTFAEQERELHRSLQLAEMNFRLQPLDVTKRSEVLRQRKAYTEMLKEWQRYEPSAYQKRFGPALPATEDLQAGLAPATTLLSYLVTADDVLLFALNQKDIQSFTLAKNDPALVQQLAEQIGQFQKTIEQDDAGSFIPIADQLYRQLVAPASDLLRSARSLLILADGPLRQLPFEALLTKSPKNNRRPFSKLDFLIKDMAVQYQYVLGWDKTSQPEEEMPERHLLALSPTPDQQSTFEMVTPMKTGQFSFEKATETRLRQELQHPAYLHLTAKAFVRGPIPEEVGLELAKPSITEARPGDGVLYASEILSLAEVQAQLLTLDSIGVEIENNDDPLYATDPLCGSLLRAGVFSVLCPQWTETTAALLPEFYSEILEGESTAAALQAAKKAMIKKSRTAAPKNWAGYRLYE